MRSIRFENAKSIKAELEGGLTVMYGAGGNGERIRKVLKDFDIRIDYFCDDDYNKWGKRFCGIEVISFEKLTEKATEQKMNVILTSVFGGPILRKLESLNVTVYEAFSILIDRYYKNSFYKTPLSEGEIDSFVKQINELKNYINDKESVEILEKIKFTVCNPQKKDYARFFSVASHYDCYFVEEVLRALPENPVIVDCGGFTGDLMVALKRHDIDYKKVYSFEVNKELFSKMKENISANKLENRFIPINKGVWNTKGISFLNVDPHDIAGGKLQNDCSQGIKIETVTIDEVFSDIPYDFVKMDIEGAERNAIWGGYSYDKKIQAYHGNFIIPLCA